MSVSGFLLLGTGCYTERIGIPASGAISAAVARRLPFPPVRLALCPVLAQGWVIGSTAACDLGEAGQRAGVGLDPLCLPFPACPGAVAPARACLHPWTALGRVSAFRPGSEPLPRGVSGCLADVLGCTVPGGRRPSPYDGVACLHAVPCRGVLVSVHVGSECPQVVRTFAFGGTVSHVPCVPHGLRCNPRKFTPSLLCTIRVVAALRASPGSSRHCAPRGLA